jgi:hypothetical protein
VKFGYQLSICSRSEENHGKSWSGCRSQDLPDTNCLLASSPALNTRTPTSVPICVVALFEKFVDLVFTNSVRTSQETHYVSATKPSRLMLFRETVAVYRENHTEHTDTLCVCVQNIEIQVVHIVTAVLQASK